MALSEGDFKKINEVLKDNTSEVKDFYESLSDVFDLSKQINTQYKNIGDKLRKVYSELDKTREVIKANQKVINEGKNEYRNIGKEIENNKKIIKESFVAEEAYNSQKIAAQEKLQRLEENLAKTKFTLQRAERDLVRNAQEKVKLEEAAVNIKNKEVGISVMLSKVQRDIAYAEESGLDTGEAYETLLKSRLEFLDQEKKAKIEGVLIAKKMDANASQALSLQNESIKLNQRQVDQESHALELVGNIHSLEDMILATKKERNIKDNENIELHGKQVGILKTIKKSQTEIVKAREDESRLMGQISSLQAKLNFWKLLQLGYDRFVELDKAAENFRKTTGFTTTQMAELRKNVESVNKDFAVLGVTIENAYKAAQALTDVFGRTSLVTKDAIENIALMSANLGVVEADAAEALSIFQGMGGATQEVAMNTMMAGAALSEKTGVPFSKVMGDIAKSSGTTAMLLGTTPSKLMKAAIAARALGTDLNTIAAQQEKLLNYSDSINSELEASALLGRSISFQRARQLAYEGKVEESAKATLDMVKQAGDFNEMNIYQRKALAAASGMELKDLTKMMAVEAQKNEIRTKGTDAQKEQLKMQEAELEKLRKTNDLTKDSVLEENKKAIAQAKIQGLMTQINSLLDQMKTTFADLLEPVITPLIKILIPAFKFLSLVVKGIAPIIKGMVYPFQYIAEKISEWTDGLNVALNTSKKFKEFFENDVIKVLLGAIGVIGSGLLIKRMFFGGENPKSILEMISAPFKAAKDGAKNLMQRVTGKSPVADMVKPKLPDASKGIADTAKATERTPSGTGVKEFLTNLASGLKKMGDGKVLLGALNLIPASIGLVAMAPGFVGAKLLENINGEALNTALSSLAEGLKKMAGGKVLLGALNLIPASIGLIAMIPGAIGMAAIGVTGELFAVGAKGLAQGLSALANPKVLLGTLALLGIGGAFALFGLGAKLVADAFVSIAAVIPEAIVPLTQLALLSPLLYVAAGGIGALAVGLGVLAAATIPATVASVGIYVIAKSVEKLGNSFEQVSKNTISLAKSIPTVINPIKQFASINMKETAEGMMMLSNSLASFGVGSAVAGIGSFVGNFLGGDPIAKMEKLASISDRLKDAASAISSIASATSRFSAVDSFAKSVGVLADSLNKLTDSLGDIKTEELAKLSTIAGATGARTEAAPAATTMSTEGIEAKLDKLTELLVGGAVKVYIDGKNVSAVVANTAGR